MTRAQVSEVFGVVARRCADYTGRPVVFIAAVALMLAWGACGPLAHWSDTWQLVANTATTLATTLLVLLIQNSQNHDTAEIKVMIAELIRANGDAHNSLASLKDLSEAQLRALQERFAQVAREDSSPQPGGNPPWTTP